MARFAAAYGTIICPSGLSESQTVIGLMANINHIRARQIVDTATAISAAMSPDGIPADILNRAAENKEDSLRMQAASWKQAGRDSLTSQFGG